MDGHAILPWLTPLVCAVFGGLLYAMSMMRDELRNARLFALSYAFATIASTIEIAVPQAGVANFGRLTCESLYIAATATMIAAVAREWRGVAVSVLAIGGFAAGIGQLLFFSFVHVDLPLRVLGNSIANGALLAAAALLIVGRTRRKGDHVVMVALAALGLAVAGNGAVSFIADELTKENYLVSRHVAFLNFIVSLGSLVVALSLIAHFGLSLLRMMDRLAVEDALTRTLNRRGFEAEARPGLAGGIGGALVLADIDHFKRINDTFGHQTGDEVIRRVAGVLMELAPEGAQTGRLGGEEFGIFLPNSDIRSARLLAVAARQAIAALDFSDTANDLRVTASFGAATGRCYDDVFQRADAALYRAKETGRDRVMCDGLPGEDVVAAA